MLETIRASSRIRIRFEFPRNPFKPSAYRWIESTDRASLHERTQARLHTEGKLSAGINFSSVNNATSLSRATARACRPHPPVG